MTDRHPHPDDLLDLALGDVHEPDRLVRHLASCPPCRAEYDEIATTVDHVLPAAPRIEPRPGFDQRVLAAMGMPPPAATVRVRRWATVAAAAVCGLVLGIGAAWVVLDDDTPARTAAAGAVALRTGDGARVGGVSRSFYEGDPVLVVEVTAGKAGMFSACRLRLADGGTVSSGEWTMRSPRATWVVDVPVGDIVALELVTDAGKVWSSASL